MTIFDVIRYPISNPPAFEELKSLPKAVYIEWLWWKRSKDARSPGELIEVIDSIESRELLKRLLLEYEE